MKTKMPRPARNKNLNDVNPAIFMKFCCLLDLRSGWKQLLNVLPEEFTSNYIFKSQLEREESLKNGRPSEFMLKKLGDSGTTVGDLIGYMENLDMDHALVLFKNFEPVNIIVDLPCEMETEAHVDFAVECKATGFPKPKYRWFKLLLNDDGDLLKTRLKSEDQFLNVSDVSWDDEGDYFCEVYNENPEYDNERSLFPSSTMTLKVTTIREQKPPEKPKAPVIIRQPCPPNCNSFVIGCSVSFKCVAQGDEPIIYEWYRNGSLMPEVGCTLTVDNLRKEKDESKFEFQCRVSNDHGSVLSNMVKIALTSPTVPYPVPQNVADDKVALLIGNTYYDTGELPSVKSDATQLALKLREMDFKVITLIDLTKSEMEHAVTIFSHLIDSHVYVVFYYAGHGFQRNGQSFMLPVDAQADCGPADCLCLDSVVDKIQEHDPALCCMIIDMCRRNISDDVTSNYVTKEPVVTRNTIIAYATSNFCTALDGLAGKNSVYMRHLLKYVSEDRFVYDVLQSAVTDMSVEPLASNKQNPQIVSNLGLPLKLTDKIEVKDNAKAMKRLKYYEYIIKHKLDFEIKGKSSNTSIQFHLQPYDQVIHNVLRMRILVHTTTANDRPFAALNFSKDSMPVAKFNQMLDDSGDQMVNDVQIMDLQKIREPLLLKVVTYNGKSAMAVQQVNIEFPMISKVFYNLATANADAY